MLLAFGHCVYWAADIKIIINNNNNDNIGYVVWLCENVWKRESNDNRIKKRRRKKKERKKDTKTERKKQVYDKKNKIKETFAKLPDCRR